MMKQGRTYIIPSSVQSLLDSYYIGFLASVDSHQDSQLGESKSKSRIRPQSMYSQN